MIDTLQIGPAALPVPMLLLFASYGIGSWLGARQAHQNDVVIKSPLFPTLIVGLLVARLGFIGQFHDVYLSNPLDIIDIRDGGWNLYSGWAAAWAYTLWRMLRQPVLRKYLFISLLSAGAIWLLGTAMLSFGTSDKPPLPNISLPALSGESVALSTYKGKPTVINLWATWCPPCQREMPILHQAQMAHPEIRFVFLNQGESSDVVAKFLSTEKLSLQNVLLDSEQQVAEKFEQHALPTTLFFDAEGKLADMRLGELSRATLTQRLNNLSHVSKGNP
ncbi:MAG TPA: TlpA disulfide reductase family protein [Herbaspirillum sp.]